MLKNTVIKLIAFVVLILFISACGDNGTEATEGETPSLPNLEYSQPDISYFQNAKIKTKENSTNYNLAQSIVLGLSGLISIGQIYSGFLESAPSNESSFSDGVWEWSYSYSYGGLNSSMRLTAEESGSQISWALYWSFDDGQGNSIEDYMVMEGTTRNDGLEGEWFFNSLNPDTNTPFTILHSSWMTDGETEKEILIELFEEGNPDGTITVNYDQNGNDFLMNASFPDDSESNYEIFWNPEAEFGYIQQGTEEALCWDSSSSEVVNIDCSELPI